MPIPNNLLRQGSWTVLGTAQGGLDDFVDDDDDDDDDYGEDHGPKQHAEAISVQSQEQHRAMMTMTITVTAVMMVTQGFLVRHEKEEQGQSARQAK